MDFFGNTDEKILGEVKGSTVYLYDPSIYNKTTTLDLFTDKFKYVSENAFNRAHQEYLGEEYYTDALYG